jgi:hypothetical protein
MSAECEKCGHDLPYEGNCEWCALVVRAEKAEAENARLRVCGTCGHVKEESDYEDWWLWCPLREPDAASISLSSTYGRMVEYRDPCHSDPSKWTPYWGEP